jgi:subtilisin-like proprotein convertase family protein
MPPAGLASFFAGRGGVSGRWQAPPFVVRFTVSGSIRMSELRLWSRGLCFANRPAAANRHGCRATRRGPPLCGEALERRDLLTAKPVPVFGVPGGFGDRFEPNDDVAQAADLGVLGDFSESGLSIHAPFNDDYFRLEMENSGRLEITVSFVHALGDIDIALLDEGSNFVAVSDSVLDGERVQYGVLSGEVYYLYVVGYDGAVNPSYDLTIHGPAAIDADRFEPNDDIATATDLGEITRRVERTLSIHAAGNDDYFRFTAAAAGPLEVAVDFDGVLGDVDVQLLDAGFNVVGGAETTADVERFTAAVETGAVYYVRVFGFEGATNADYRLVLDGPIRRGDVSGVVWDDQNGDGVRDDGEPGLFDRRVYVDGNGNGQFDTIVARSDVFAAAGLPLAIEDFGTVASTIEVSGIDRPIYGVWLELSLTHTYVSDLRGFLTGPDGTRIELFAYVGGSGDNMTGTMLSDTSPTPIAQSVAPFTGLFRPLRPLGTFAGLPANGQWALEIADDVGGDTGSLVAWSIEFFVEGYVEVQAATDADGVYAITGLPVGAHSIVQLLPPDWEFTYPATAPAQSVAVDFGETTPGVDFGNRSTMGANAHVVDVRLARSGSAAAGYSIPVGDAGQVEPIALVGVDQIVVVFDRAWDVGPDSLELHGVNTESYPTVDAMFTTTTGEGNTLVATWTLASALEADNLLAVVRSASTGMVTLDGEWTNPAEGQGGSVFPSGDGSSGGDFAFRFNVLAGDANRDGQVSVSDVVYLAQNGFVDMSHANYDARGDVDGNGVVNVEDAVLAAIRIGASLPAGEPSAMLPAGAMPNGALPVGPTAAAADAIVARAEALAVDRPRVVLAHARGVRFPFRGGAIVDASLTDRSLGRAPDGSANELRALRVRRAMSAP